jgi:hypothetical protein
LATEGTNKGEKINVIIACSSEKSGKSLQIVNYLWPEPILQYQTISLAGDIEFRVGKKKTLDKTRYDYNLTIMKSPKPATDTIYSHIKF